MPVKKVVNRQSVLKNGVLNQGVPVALSCSVDISQGAHAHRARRERCIIQYCARILHVLVKIMLSLFTPGARRYTQKARVAGRGALKEWGVWWSLQYAEGGSVARGCVFFLSWKCDVVSEIANPPEGQVHERCPLSIEFSEDLRQATMPHWPSSYLNMHLRTPHQPSPPKNTSTHAPPNETTRTARGGTYLSPKHALRKTKIPPTWVKKLGY